MSDAFIVIGESIHASIPKTAKAMKQLAAMGSDAYTGHSEPLDYITNLIRFQADEGAHYIAVNLDAFGEDNPRKAVDMMKKYVELVRKYSNGIPVCIDSSNDDVLTAGLEQWYNTPEKPPRPLINSIKTYTMNRLLTLKKDLDYAFVGMLMSEHGKNHNVDNLYSLAKKIFSEAVSKYDFKPDEIFFDSTIFPLAIDMPMEPGQPGYTYTTFQTMKKIKSDPEIKGAHFTGGITNCARDLPARKIGVMRAFVHKAMQYGLDSAIANPKHHLNEGDPDPELMKLVQAYAEMDGSAEKMNNAMTLMSKFCKDNR